MKDIKRALYEAQIKAKSQEGEALNPVQQALQNVLTGRIRAINDDSIQPEPEDQEPGRKAERQAVQAAVTKALKSAHIRKS